jgi:hypothetical protein
VTVFSRLATRLTILPVLGAAEGVQARRAELGKRLARESSHVDWSREKNRRVESKRALVRKSRVGCRRGGGRGSRRC